MNVVTSSRGAQDGAGGRTGQVGQEAQEGHEARLAARPRVAAIVTSYYPRSHADVIVSKLLADYTHPAPRDLERYDFHRAVQNLTEAPLPVNEVGRLRPPRVRVVSLYTDQVPENDISREWAARANIPIFPTVREALTLGSDRLAVDGILIIGEHGDYPTTERGQKEYPRRRLFAAAIEVVRESGRPVPIFNDKHLSYAWTDAKWMYDTARALGVPLLAGSSISTVPVSWRDPALEVPLGAPLHGALAVGHGPIESYGFHTLEVLQCMVERRAGGETGVAAVQALAGPDVWQAGEAGRWDRELLNAALATLEQPLTQDPRQLAARPAVFLVQYRDGLQAAVCLLDGVVREWLFAARMTFPYPDRSPDRTAGQGQGLDSGRPAPQGSGASPVSQVVATRFRSHNQEPYGHFAYLAEKIQDLICTGREPHPVERTLLTTGVLDRAMESLWRGGARLETPELALRYQVAA